MSDSAGDGQQLITETARAHILARCLHVVAELGVADALGDEPATAAQLAAGTGLNADALNRLLRLLSSNGIFATTDPSEREAPAAPADGRAGDAYRHTEASRLLRSDHPASLRAYVRMQGMPAMWNGFHELGRVVRTGRPATEWTTLLADFAKQPDQAKLFNEAMTLKSRRVVPAVLDTYDFGSFGVIADIGGGRGHLLRAILARVPSATGVLFDLPHVIADAEAFAMPRLALVGGDFFRDPLPRADAYVLMDLLHDWADGDAARILAAVRRAAPAHARVLIVETLLPDVPGPHFGKTLDVIMLAVTGGRERSRARFRDMLEAADLRLSRIVATDSEYSVVEAVVTGSGEPNVPAAPPR